MGQLANFNSISVFRMNKSINEFIYVQILAHRTIFAHLEWILEPGNLEATFNFIYIYNIIIEGIIQPYNIYIYMYGTYMYMCVYIYIFIYKENISAGVLPRWIQGIRRGDGVGNC